MCCFADVKLQMCHCQLALQSESQEATATLPAELRLKKRPTLFNDAGGCCFRGERSNSCYAPGWITVEEAHRDCSSNQPQQQLNTIQISLGEMLDIARLNESSGTCVIQWNVWIWSSLCVSPGGMLCKDNFFKPYPPPLFFSFLFKHSLFFVWPL